MHRPIKFSQVIGQDIAIKLIKNALNKDKLPQTLIFHGPSGVGKTTLARLIAAWYVCSERNEDICGKCKMCKSIQNGTIPDIIEFDAASNTSVDDIREILTQCSYAPQFSKEKIFIIDEAHMLSRNAISALLKTFEETQQHVRFILATTEIEKIPNSIQSRCFCIPLQEISKTNMQTQMKTIAIKNNINFEEEALELISAFSYGSLREAISIFYRTLMLENIVDKKNVYQALGCVEDEVIKKIIQLLLNGSFVEVFELLNKVLQEKNTPASALLKQLIITCIKNFEQFDKIRMTKILIDLNKLQAEIGKNFAFSEGVIIGLAQIAYENKL